MTPDATHDHHYRAGVRWDGSTGEGYEAYDRNHVVSIEGAAPVSFEASGDAAFRGDPALPNPEQLLLAAATSCQLLSFLAVAARGRVDVVAYEDDGEAFMPAGRDPVGITLIRLRPRITVRGDGGDVTEAKLRRFVEIAHHECFIANTLNCEMEIEAELHWLP
ncbi:MAG TPA: OsmC family protein [Acidimicrobiales bacterium]|nr:OsmC family protein [Acidimicrobiales bacterium]